MKEKLLKMKDQNLFFICLNIYMVILLFLPKKYSSIQNIPVRLILTFILLVVFIVCYHKGKIKLNKTNHLKLYIVFSLFLIATIPSLFVSYSITTSIYTILKYAMGFLLFSMLIKINFKKEEYKILLKNILICTAILTIIGLVSYLLGFNLMIKGSGINYYPGAKGRLNTTFFNTIYYGVFIDLVMPLLLYVIYKTRSKLKLIISMILFGLLYSNLIFTFTRSTLVVFFIILFIMLVAFNKRILKYRTILIIVIITCLSLTINGAKPLIQKTSKDVYTMASKFSNILGFLPSFEDQDGKYLDYDDDSDFVDYSLQHRAAFAKMANRIAKDHPYTGVGFGAYINYMNSKEFDLNYPEYTLPKTHPHSSLTLINAECGIFGLIGLIIVLSSLTLMSFSMVIKNYKKNNKAYIYSVFAFSIILGFIAINVMTENAIYDTQIAYLFYLVYGIFLSYVYKISSNRVMFISSTGGHLNELLQMKSLFDKYDSYIVTEKTKSNMSLKSKYENVKYLAYGTKDYKFKYLFKFIYNILKSIIIYIRIHPNVIVTTGTHTAVPMCYIGKLFGSKIIFIETFANSKTKTLSGKLVYPIADTFIVQWDSMRELYPKSIFGGWIY